ncbi:hypothetical protein [Gorillibacterium massiliense]|uniref:hypothetical protein n=1 Tax=Gorillibacterium massiliense TaxID=1280390 RepID=UPI0004BB0E21|nr:hypothetical protein [Gorillibacterium massiliense]
MAHTLIPFWLYTLPLLAVVYLLQLALQIVNERRIPLATRIRHFYGSQKESFIRRYRVSPMDEEFETAGLTAAGITPLKYKLARDLLFLSIMFVIHLRFIQLQGSYPMVRVAFVLLLYLALQLRPRFPVVYALQALRVRFVRKKNAEIFILQQLISNEFADANASKQNIYHMFLYLRRFVRYLRPAVDRFLEEYPVDPINREKAFRSFSRLIGTPEGETLAQILYQVDQSSPEEVRDILEKRYEELKKKRQEAYRGAMRDRGTVAYLITFSGLLMVILCGLFVYYLEYRDMMSGVYTLH